MKRHTRWGLLGFVVAIIPTLLVSELIYPHEVCPPCAVPVVDLSCRDEVWDMDRFDKVICPPGATATTKQHTEDEFTICSCPAGVPTATPDASVPDP